MLDITKATLEEIERYAKEDFGVENTEIGLEIAISVGNMIDSFDIPDSAKLASLFFIRVAYERGEADAARKIQALEKN